MYSLNENALEKSAQSPKSLKSLGSERKPLNLELEDEMLCYFVSRFFMHTYFRAMLILRCHSFGKCLFSSHAYFHEFAYYQENTVDLFCVWFQGQ